MVCEEQVRELIAKKAEYIVHSFALVTHTPHTTECDIMTMRVVTSGVSFL